MAYGPLVYFFFDSLKGIAALLKRKITLPTFVISIAGWQKKFGL